MSLDPRLAGTPDLEPHVADLSKLGTFHRREMSLGRLRSWCRSFAPAPGCAADFLVLVRAGVLFGDFFFVI